MLESFNFRHLSSTYQTSGVDKFASDIGAQKIAHRGIGCSGYLSKDARLCSKNGPVRIPERSYLPVEPLMGRC